MKKFFIALVMCLVAMAANAQNGWQTITDDGDELKGTTCSVSYIYQGDDGIFGFNGEKGYIFIIPDAGIIDYDVYDNAKGVVIGLYDQNDNLIERIKTPANKTFRVVNRGQSAFCTKDNVNKRVVDFIKNEHGFVRVIADRYSRSDFDVKVPCMK